MSEVTREEMIRCLECAWSDSRYIPPCEYKKSCSNVDVCMNAREATLSLIESLDKPEPKGELIPLDKLVETRLQELKDGIEFFELAVLDRLRSSLSRPTVMMGDIDEFLEHMSGVQELVPGWGEAIAEWLTDKGIEVTDAQD